MAHFVPLLFPPKERRKQSTREQILALIRRSSEPVTREYIQRVLKLSYPTVAKQLARLGNEKLVYESYGHADGNTGKPPFVYHPRTPERIAA